MGRLLVVTADSHGRSRAVVPQIRHFFRRLCLSWLTSALLLVEVTSSTSDTCMAPVCRLGTPCRHEFPECAGIPMEGRRFDWIELTHRGFQGTPKKTGRWHLSEQLEHDACPVIVTVLDALAPNAIDTKFDCNVTLHRELLRATATAQQNKTVSIGDKSYNVRAFKNLKDAKKSAQQMEHEASDEPRLFANQPVAPMRPLADGKFEPSRDNAVAISASQVASSTEPEEKTDGLVELMFDDTSPDDYDFSDENPFGEDGQRSMSTELTAATEDDTTTTTPVPEVTSTTSTSPSSTTDEPKQSVYSGVNEQANFTKLLKINVTAGEMFSFDVGFHQAFRVRIEKTSPRALWLFVNNTTHRLDGFTLYTSMGTHYFGLWSLADNNILVEGLLTIRPRDSTEIRELNHRFITEEIVPSRLADTTAHIASLAAADATAGSGSSDTVLVLSVKRRHDLNTIEWARQSLLSRDLCSEERNDTRLDSCVLPDSDESRITMFIPACSAWRQAVTEIVVVVIIMLMVCIPFISCVWTACRKPTSIMASKRKEEKSLIFST
ncbi:hypothetical protein BIW11_01189 [Tropilaelaps mercedesae]|uniref:Uncharacterized protein n=1 Tax=Tropilaelaps mercedesae TaxID=418985 RepID=A0A1V9XIC8_9ACAR|nr:hypothetical protein BIW11_01189 [Tropilaelaps mercedesae]